jgi:hypothetical protein
LNNRQLFLMENKQQTTHVNTRRRINASNRGFVVNRVQTQLKPIFTASRRVLYATSSRRVLYATSSRRVFSSASERDR